MTEPAPSFVILVFANLSQLPARTPAGDMTEWLRATPTTIRRRLKDVPVVTVTRDSLPRLRARLKPGDPDSPEWLGLTYLVDAAAYPRVKVKVWDVSKRELLRDLQRAPEPESSATFKRIFLEGLGTFQAQATGLILADLYIGPDAEDMELAQKLQYTAAACDAPLLMGVSSLPTASAMWQAVRRAEESRFLFPLYPRWRNLLRPGDGVWLNPGYAIAMRAGAALRNCELAEAAANLLPDWNRSQAAAFAGTAGDVPAVAEFERGIDDQQRAELHEAGINALSDASLGGTDAFISLTPAMLCASPKAKGTLATALLRGHIHHRVLDYIRRRRSSDSGAAAARFVHDWFSAHTPCNGAGEPLMKLKNVAVAKDKLKVVLQWHEQAGGTIEQLEVRVPGIGDDRVQSL